LSEKDSWSTRPREEENPTAVGNQTQTVFPSPIILLADLQELMNFTSAKDMLILAKRIWPCTIYTILLMLLTGVKRGLSLSENERVDYPKNEGWTGTIR
jgi:hypothetical protein